MKRKVARRRWRRAIWAVRFNCRLSGGKHIKFEKEPTEPDARQPNDSIDMDFITKIEKDEPKYFHQEVFCITSLSLVSKWFGLAT